jgi:hypothetical protein
VTVVSDVECVVVGVEENIEPGIRLCGVPSLDAALACAGD